MYGTAVQIFSTAPDASVAKVQLTMAKRACQTNLLLPPVPGLSPCTRRCGCGDRGWRRRRCVGANGGATRASPFEYRVVGRAFAPAVLEGATAAVRMFIVQHCLGQGCRVSDQRSFVLLITPAAHLRDRY